MPADQSQGSVRVSDARMCTRGVKSGLCVENMNPKNTKKSPIHENADADITCEFGDCDISRLGVANQTHVYKHTMFVSWIILRCIMFWCRDYLVLYIHTTFVLTVNSICWAPHEFGLMLACGSSDGSISILSSTGEPSILYFTSFISHFVDIRYKCTNSIHNNK